MSQPSDPDYLFNIFKLNKWFAITSALLLVGTLLMIKDDYDKEWKQWQRKFRTLEIEKTKKEIGTAKEELAANSAYSEAKTALGESQKELRKKEVDIFEIQRTIKKLEGMRYAVFVNFQEMKSTLDSLVYQLEEARHNKSPNIGTLESRIYGGSKNLKRKKGEKPKPGLQPQIKQLQKELDSFDAQISDNKKKVDEIQQSKIIAEENLKKLEAKLSRLERKEGAIGRSFVNDIFRDAPMIDFINPSLKVKEIIVNDLKLDYNFTKVPRADACVTCHVAIDVPGYEEQANPLKTHPKLDLYLGTKSPHKIEEFGCTTCHQGLGGALTFTNAAHSPQNESQEKAWEKKYHWHRMKHWDEPMLPLPYTEATCLGCHAQDVDVMGTTRLQKGIHLVERSGCYGCHKIEGWEKIRRTGPSLRRITSKVSNDWILKWVKNPRLFRPTTNMPQLFDQSNSSDPKSVSRSQTEIRAIASYLSAKAEPYAPEGDDSLGNTEKGKALFGSVGCLGCHDMDGFDKISQIESADPISVTRKFAPNLSQVGSKLNVRWLKSWLKNPKNYWHDTRMPSLRLSDSEIADLAAFLLTKKNLEFERLSPPPLDRRVLREIALDHLAKKMPVSEAATQVRSMNENDLLLYVGERSILHYGCFGCHDIPGFEEAKPIGTELTFEASKNISRFDFAFAEVEKTVPSFIRQKLKEPRIFDEGKVREPLDRLKMPNFHFSEDELDSLVTFVMGLRKYSIDGSKKPALTPDRLAVRAGRRMLHDNNCRGCHIIEKIGGEILAYYEDPYSGPPNLSTQGKKTQPDWLFHFLGEPSTVRPYLNVRMPTFGFNPEERNVLIRYFRGVDKLPMAVEEPPKIVLSPETRKFAETTFKTLQCIKCHQLPPYPDEVDRNSLAPSFRLLPKRLRYDWVHEWVKDPSSIIPNTRMPSLLYAEGQFFTPEGEKQLDALRDWLFVADVYTLK